MTKIVSLTASSFRGVSKAQTLDFLVDGKPQSVLAVGDNGSGKSSFANSLEFCLRGKVSHRGNAGAKTRREARNLLTPGRAPSVSVTLDDGQSYIRGKARKGIEGIILGRHQFVPGFELCPVVISRGDIEVFWHLSPTDRLRFFFDYLRDSINHSGYAALEAERAMARLANLRAELLSAQIGLSVATAWPVAEIPTSQPAFSRWITRAYPGYQVTSTTTNKASASRGRAADSRTRSRAGNSRINPKVSASISNMLSAIENERKLNSHIAAMRKQASAADGIPEVLSRDLPELLQGISSEVTADFLTMAHLSHITAVSLSVSGPDQSLEIECILTSGAQVEPTQVLSEGALDLLAILLLLSVVRACAERGQSRFLVLDDIWQSVDTVHRMATLDYLFSARFETWQLFVTSHDRLWAKLIERRARKCGFKMKTIQFRAWTETDGPRLVTEQAGTVAQLSGILENGSPEVLGSYSGRVLEELSDELSQTLRSSISRAPGDQYTMGDLWPGVSSIIRKYMPENAKAPAQAISNELDIRNLYAAHYNQWAESFSATEIKGFASHIVELWAATHCEKCGAPFSLIDVRERTFGWPCPHEADNESVPKASRDLDTA
jgi:recombinational DNA repair ATPase RecF